MSATEAALQAALNFSDMQAAQLANEKKRRQELATENRMLRHQLQEIRNISRGPDQKAHLGPQCESEAQCPDDMQNRVPVE